MVSSRKDIFCLKEQTVKSVYSAHLHCMHQVHVCACGCVIQIKSSSDKS